MARTGSSTDHRRKRNNSLILTNKLIFSIINRIVSYRYQQEYLNFMSKKVNMRQSSIITLSDHNRQEIENLKKQKEEIQKEFEEKKTGKTIYSKLFIIFLANY